MSQYRQYSRLVEAMNRLPGWPGESRKPDSRPDASDRPAEKLLSDKIAKDVPDDEPMPPPEPLSESRRPGDGDAYLGYQEFFDKTLEVLRTLMNGKSPPTTNSLARSGAAAARRPRHA